MMKATKKWLIAASALIVFGLLLFALTMCFVGWNFKKLETETNVSDIVEVGKRFLVFLRQIDPDKALEYMPLYDAFVKECMR